jgi:copper chaperone CopZ
MKHFIILIFMFTALFFFFKSSGDARTKTTVKIKCVEMSCQGCKNKITSSIQLLDGIYIVDISLKKKIITVTYDDLKTSPDKIINAINDAGYEAELVTD